MLNTYDRDGVTVVELDRAPVNALDLELLGALTAAFDRADSPVVLTGAGRTLSARRGLAPHRRGAGQLCPGVPRRTLPRVPCRVHPSEADRRRDQRACDRGRLPACAVLRHPGDERRDDRADGAGRLAVRFPRSGLEIVRHALGAASSRVVLRADTVDPDEALRLGVVDEITEPAVLLDRAVALASQLGSYPAEAYTATKCDLQRPALEAISASGDAWVTAAWSSPQTRQRLAGHGAALAGKARGADILAPADRGSVLVVIREADCPACGHDPGRGDVQDRCPVDPRPGGAGTSRSRVCWPARAWPARSGRCDRHGFQMAVHQGDGACALADRGGDPFD